MAAPTPPAEELARAGDDEGLTTGRFAGLLALLMLLSWPQVWAGLQTFVFRDFGIFSYPLAQYFCDSFWHGEIPLWNPLSNCGGPFLAQWNTQVLYPPALFYLLLPLSWSLGVFCLLHLFWGGLGMYVLARHWYGNRLGAAVAGLAFAFSGIMLNSLMWPATVAALGWMPWVVWLGERAGREGGRTVVLAALAGALQMLSGGVEVVLVTWLLLGVLHLVDLLRGGWRHGKTWLRLALLVVLISGLSAAQLLPFFDLLDASRRSQEVGGATWPMPVTGWANFLVPLFGCHAHQGVFMQANQFWTYSYYVGVTTVGLAGVALYRRRRCPRVWGLAALGLLGLLLAMGPATPVYSWLARHCEIIGLMRFPVKFVMLPVFILPLLAAGAWRGNTASGPVQSHRMRWVWLWLILVVVVLGIIVWQWWAEPSAADREAVGLNGLMRAGLFTAVAALLFCLSRFPLHPSRRLWQVLVLLLVWFDLFQHTPQPATIGRELYRTELPREWSVPQWGSGRVLASSAVQDQFYHAFLADYSADYLARRFAMIGNCNLLDHVPTCNGFYPLYLTDHVRLFYDYYPTHQPAEGLLDFVGVSHALELRDIRYEWISRPGFMRVLTAGQKPVFADDATSLQQLTSVDFNPREVVYLPLEARPFVAASEVSPVQISEVRYAAQRIEARIQTPKATMVVVAQTFYHPWRALVDGVPVPLWHANVAFQALQLPAGTHQVALVYEDRKFYFGAAISLMTLLGCLSFVVIVRPAESNGHHWTS